MFSKIFFTNLISLVCAIVMVEFVNAQALPTGFSYSTVASGWVEPVGTTFNSTGTKMFVWQKGGQVYVCNWNGTTYVKQATAVVDIAPEVGNWRDHGMLGFALDPNFEVNGLIYMMYVVDRHYLLNFGTGSYNASTNNYLSATIGRITRYQTTTLGSNLVVVPASRTILLGESKTTGIPILYESHGVGSLAFASDGTLLATVGDAASYVSMDAGSQPETYYAQALTDGIIRANENVGAFRSQMLNSFNGKLLRLDPTNGNGVSSNPFYNAASPRSAQSRLWAFGLRNPFRMCVRPNTGSANPATGDIGEIYISEVGLDTYEELNIIKAPASNLGWPIYEGLTPSAGYYGATTANLDEPNPLFGTGGCIQQYFTFNNLLKQATADNNHTIYNPCNPAVAISSVNDNRFFHHLAALDWKHREDSTRVAVFTSNNFVIKQIGTAGSGVIGKPFQGNAATGCVWYTGTLFPPQYNNTYFVADYGSNWIRNFKIQFTDQVQSVDSFEIATTAFTSIVHLSMNPLDGTLFCTDIGEGNIYRITYGGNQAPIAKLSSDKKFGAGPLSVNFTGNTSYDPEGGHITYSWDFGDGTALNTTANPSHSFSSGNSSPKKFVVKLTVKDSVNAIGVDSLIISINNTPPNITITSPINNSTYKVGTDTAYTLSAIVTDAEHSPGQLKYVWQTALRHNNHQHVEPIDTNKLTSSVISRIGCNGDAYYWFVKLTVTDADGLSTTDSAKIFPQCIILPIKLNSFAVAAQGNINLLTWTTSEEINLRNFDIQRSYDGANFESIGTVNASPGAGTNSYQFRDNNFLDGYVYYRLKMIDRDDKSAYSFIVRVYTGKKEGSDLTVSPNPFKNQFLFGAVFTEAGKITIRLVDAKGAVAKIINSQVNIGFNSIQVDKLGNLAKGVYYLELKQGDNIRRTKLIKAD